MSADDYSYELVNGIKTPKQLVDAWMCLYRADEYYNELTVEIEKYLYNYVKKMIKKDNPKSKGSTIQLLGHEDHLITGRPKVLISDIVEKLRSALDYVVFQLSLMNVPHMNERIPQFVIADSKGKFQSQRKKLKYLTDEQRNCEQRTPIYFGDASSFSGNDKRPFMAIAIAGLIDSFCCIF